MTRQLMVIPKEDFADCFEKLKGHWENTWKGTKASLCYIGCFFFSIKWLDTFRTDLVLDYMIESRHRNVLKFKSHTGWLNFKVSRSLKCK